MYAQRVAVTKLVRHLAHGQEIAGCHRRDEAMLYPSLAGALPHSQDVTGEFGSVQMAMGINPAHGAIIPETYPARTRASDPLKRCTGVAGSGIDPGQSASLDRRAAPGANPARTCYRAQPLVR